MVEMRVPERLLHGLNGLSLRHEPRRECAAPAVAGTALQASVAIQPGYARLEAVAGPIGLLFASYDSSALRLQFEAESLERKHQRRRRQQATKASPIELGAEITRPPVFDVGLDRLQRQPVRQERCSDGSHL